LKTFFISLEKGLGSDIILWFQSWRSDWVSDLFQPLNYAGSETFFLILLTVVYWTLCKKTGRRLTIIFLLSAWLNAFLKEWWKRPRPFQVSDKINAAYPVDGYGLPSGHTQTATSIGAGLIAGIKKRWAVGLLVLYIVLTGISRMVHGVHFPQDVLLGWIFGILIVLIYLKLEKKLAPFCKEMSAGKMIGITLGGTILMFGLMMWTTPNLHAVVSIVTPMAVLAGAVPGFWIEWNKINFSVQGPVIQKILRYLLGIITALIIKEGLKPVLELVNNHTFTMEILVRFVRYFLLGLWITAGAPWLFTKAKLATKSTEPI
jgi:membrane-associated phospholipid phosphatase